MRCDARLYALNSCRIRGERMIRPALGGIEAVAFDAFGTLCAGRGPRFLLRWHDILPAQEAQRIRRAWMRGEFGPEELVRLGDVSRAPPGWRHSAAMADESRSQTTRAH